MLFQQCFSLLTVLFGHLGCRQQAVLGKALHPDELRLVGIGFECGVRGRHDGPGPGKMAFNHRIHLFDDIRVLGGEVGRFADVIFQVVEQVPVRTPFAIEENADQLPVAVMD